MAEKVPKRQLVFSCYSLPFIVEWWNGKKRNQLVCLAENENIGGKEDPGEHTAQNVVEAPIQILWW